VREFDATILFFYEDHLLLQKNGIEMRRGEEIPQNGQNRRIFFITHHHTQLRTEKKKKKKRVEQELKALTKHRSM
jgi:hypothetical protein